jgi:hypothetical protein
MNEILNEVINTENMQNIQFNVVHMLKVETNS